jgi:hypothetical protein
MKLISNILFGLGVVLLVTSIFDPFPNIHFGNIGFIAIILGVLILLIRCIEERNYKGLILIVLIPVAVSGFWKVINIPFLKGEYMQGFCGFNSEELSCYEGGYQKLTILEWTANKIPIFSNWNCGVAGCNPDDNIKPEITF